MPDAIVMPLRLQGAEVKSMPCRIMSLKMRLPPEIAAATLPKRAGKQSTRIAAQARQSRRRSSGLIFLGMEDGGASGFRFGSWIAELSAGKPLLAGDQPISVDAVNAHSTTILAVRAGSNGRCKCKCGIGMMNA